MTEPLEEAIEDLRATVHYATADEKDQIAAAIRRVADILKQTGQTKADKR